MHYLSQEKFNSLKEELERIKKEGRQEIADRLRQAKELGDLSENAEYSEAKEAQSKIETRIIELENILRNSSIIKKSFSKSQVEIGSVIKLEKNGKELSYTIVGSNEANPQSNFISNESPLGRAFLYKKAGDIVEVETPKGKSKYKIISIE